jgi:hypothetical protein
LAHVSGLNLHRLAKLALLGSRQHCGQVTDALACAARLQARAKMGRGSALALLGSHCGQVAEVLACAGRLQPSAKIGVGSVELALLNFVCSACVGVELLACQLALHAPGPERRWGRVVALSLLGPHCWWPRAKLGGGGQQRLLCLQHLACASRHWQGIGGSR